MQKLGWLSGALAALALVSGSALAAPQGPDSVRDDSISEQVLARLIQEGQLSADKIDVRTRNGFVTIQGKVPSADAAKRAILLAEATDGVRGVWVDFEAE